MKRVCILGSTGSMGTQTLDVISQFPDNFSVSGLSTHQNIGKLQEQIRQFKPSAVCVVDQKKANELSKTVGIPVYSGAEGLNQLVELPPHHVVFNNIVGASGLVPTLHAMQHGKDIALANKETIVMAGQLVMQTAAECGVQILPVDSEHSAIFQCLNGFDASDIQRLILTCSGGPFFGKTRDDLQAVTVQQALKHPKWNMGAKISIDSATLMNKGLEVIEAHWLFNTPGDAIDVVIHPEAIIHSLVEFKDGSVQAQLAVPDARLPIQVALTYPQKYTRIIKRLDLTAPLSFAEPDTTTFPCLGLAYRALHVGGTMPCALNAANEVAVQKFLDGCLALVEIPMFIEDVMNSHQPILVPTLEDILNVNAEIRSEFLTQVNY